LHNWPADNDGMWLPHLAVFKVDDTQENKGHFWKRIFKN